VTLPSAGARSNRPELRHSPARSARGKSAQSDCDIQIGAAAAGSSLELLATKPTGRKISMHAVVRYALPDIAQMVVTVGGLAIVNILIQSVTESISPSSAVRTESNRD
jgi:hypothetical protein